MTEDKQKPGYQYSKNDLFKRQQDFVNRHQFKDAPVIIADNIHTPENIAAIIRVADSAGSKKVFFVNSDVSAVSKKISRIARSADSSMRIEFISSEHCYELKDELSPIVAIEITSESADIYETELPANCSLLVGSERHGISDELLEICDSAVHLPMFGQNSSMNVAQALSIVLYEWRRQQHYS